MRVDDIAETRRDIGERNHPLQPLWKSWFGASGMIYSALVNNRIEGQEGWKQDWPQRHSHRVDGRGGKVELISDDCASKTSVCGTPVTWGHMAVNLQKIWVMTARTWYHLSLLNISCHSPLNMTKNATETNKLGSWFVQSFSTFSYKLGLGTRRLSACLCLLGGLNSIHSAA